MASPAFCPTLSSLSALGTIGDACPLQLLLLHWTKRKTCSSLCKTEQYHSIPNILKTILKLWCIEAQRDSWAAQISASKPKTTLKPTTTVSSSTLGCWKKPHGPTYSQPVGKGVHGQKWTARPGPALGISTGESTKIMSCHVSSPMRDHPTTVTVVPPRSHPSPAGSTSAPSTPPPQARPAATARPRCPQGPPPAS